jgi:hypothetical protein
VQSDLSKLPIPQFVIDGAMSLSRALAALVTLPHLSPGEGFDVHKTTREVVQGTAVQWTLVSTMNYFHPFHIHVNPFQVKQVFN